MSAAPESPWVSDYMLARSPRRIVHVGALYEGAGLQSALLYVVAAIEKTGRSKKPVQFYAVARPRGGGPWGDVQIVVGGSLRICTDVPLDAADWRAAYTTVLRSGRLPAEALELFVAACTQGQVGEGVGNGDSGDQPSMAVADGGEADKHKDDPAPEHKEKRQQLQKPPGQEDTEAECDIEGRARMLGVNSIAPRLPRGWTQANVAAFASTHHCPHLAAFLGSHPHVGMTGAFLMGVPGEARIAQCITTFEQRCMATAAPEVMPNSQKGTGSSLLGVSKALWRSKSLRRDTMVTRSAHRRPVGVSDSDKQRGTTSEAQASAAVVLAERAGRQRQCADERLDDAWPA
eukprot:m51a1_g10106 hypothetical protein (346) ;mRNA; r:129275-136008